MGGMGEGGWWVGRWVGVLCCLERCQRACARRMNNIKGPSWPCQLAPPTTDSIVLVCPFNLLSLQVPADKGAEDLYAAVNIIKEPSMIRVEADEVTYPLHIILRCVCAVRAVRMLCLAWELCELAAGAVAGVALPSGGLLRSRLHPRLLHPTSLC